MLASFVALVGALAKDRITAECKRFDRRRDGVWTRDWSGSASGKVKEAGDHEVNCFPFLYPPFRCFGLKDNYQEMFFVNGDILRI